MPYIDTLTYLGPARGGNGVDLHTDHLLWWEGNDPGCTFAGGGAVEQSLEEFMKKDAPIEGVPAETVAQVRAWIEKNQAGRV